MGATEKVAFISGANRGIGYQLAVQFAATGYQVVTGYRDESRSTLLLTQAQTTDTMHPFRVDVTSEDALASLHTFIANQFGRVDILINNAGINTSHARGVDSLAWADIAHHLDVNTGGAFLATKHLYPLIQKGTDKKIVNISSQLGSIARGGGGSIPYSVSKAALNMLTQNLSRAFQSDGVTVVSIHPGWVRTDMGGQTAPLSAEESAAHIIDTVHHLSPAQTGTFINYDGSPMPY